HVRICAGPPGKPGGYRDETPKPGDPRLRAVQSLVLASNRTALRAAAAEAEERGYRVVDIAHDVSGEARHIGTQFARRALSLGSRQCLLYGGESTVVVRGGGRGGRNQELVLAAACELDRSERDVIVLSGGTDGIDGPTDAAGAWATPATLDKGRKMGLDAHRSLQCNDAYTYFDGVGQLIRTGPTHTNVMDVGLALIGTN
ncbi:MAG: hydroxypyruvate reductase, partial [Bacteroidota bacterium]|nr:hydroxypyruvate reductase [Bacteroidota bacterium]